MLNHALRYLRLGFSVIPLKPKSKEPLLNWKEFQQRKASEQELRNWYKKRPTAGIGIVTGVVSGIVIVDLDGPDGIKEAEKLQLTSQTAALTGKGKHLWYKHPGGIVQNSVRKYQGIDVRGDGGFVLAPPSVHPNGKRYRWLKPVTSAEMLPLFPTGVFASNALKTVQDADSLRNQPGWISQALEGMKIGNIDDTLFTICARLRNDGYTKEDTFTLLKPHADNAGATEGHLQDKISNVWGRYEPKPGVRLGNGQFNGLTLYSPTNPDSLIEYDKRRQASESRVEYATGYPKFDTLTKGLKKGEILTVAARTGVGKTNWIIAPIRTFCNAGQKVLLFSTEMSFDHIWGRYKAVLGKCESFERHQFYICDEFTPNPERIEEALRTVMPDLFLFDHINHVGTEHHELAKFMMSLKELARKFNIPGIVTAQLNRAADWVENGERVTPRLSMIKGSGSIEEISAQVLLLSEKRVYPDYTEIEGVVDKNRHGDKGIVHFGLKKEPYRMEEI